MQQNWPYLSGIPFAEYIDAQLGILIGEDNAFVMAPQRIVKHKPQTPIATKTPLGWTISGKDSTAMVSEMSFVFHAYENFAEMDELHQFTMDDFGVKTNMAKGRSREDERALELMIQTAVRMPEQRWDT